MSFCAYQFKYLFYNLVIIINFYELSNISQWNAQGTLISTRLMYIKWLFDTLFKLLVGVHDLIYECIIVFLLHIGPGVIL